jgi:hypothetical protein
MTRKLNVVVELFNKHIEGTIPKKKVPKVEVFIGKINKKKATETKIKARKVYINARVVKKLYDSRCKENPKEFNLIIQNIKQFVINPDDIYKNESFKTATHLLVKKKDKHSYLCFIQLQRNKKQFKIMTVFPVSDDSYLDRFKLM